MESKDYQTMLSLGYVYIVILGILKEAFFYSQIGVDYFKYAAISDILLSPLSDLTRNVYGLIFFIVLVLLTLFLPSWFIKHKDKKWVQQGIKIDFNKEFKVIHEQLSNFFVFMLCISLMGFYVGIGMGGGYRYSKELENGDLKFADKIAFVNGDTETVHLLGKTNSFIFYLPEGESEIKITPTNSGHLKSIIENR